MGRSQRSTIRIAGLVCALSLTAAGCASAPKQHSLRRPGRSASLSPLAFSLNGALERKESGKKALGSDQTVKVGGMLSNTVNEVVPIPGTDMIKVGALQEGSLFQSNFRSPQQETTGQSGSILTDATVVLRILRPMR